MTSLRAVQRDQPTRQPRKGHDKGVRLTLMPAATRPLTPAPFGVSAEVMSAAREDALRARDTPAMLYAEATEHEMLDAAQEATLARAAQDGDTQARDALVHANVRLAMKIAYDYHVRLTRGQARAHGDVIGAELDDLVNDGLLGVVRAIETYRPELGYRFTTYATPWIRQRILRGINGRMRLVRIPEYKLRTLRASARRGELPAHLRAPYSLDQMLTPDHAEIGADDGTLQDFLPSAAAEEALDRAEREADALLSDDSVTNIMRRLGAKPRHARAMSVIARYALQEQTLEEIAQDFGISRERVRQLREEGFALIRNERARIRAQRDRRTPKNAPTFLYETRATQKKAAK